MHADIHDPQDVLMPAAFIGHGNPMNALEVNRYTTAWKAFGAATPRPRAILVISALRLRFLVDDGVCARPVLPGRSRRRRILAAACRPAA